MLSAAEKLFQIIDRYEPSRPGSLAFTKLEEMILWAQVMVQQVPVKAPVAEVVDPEVKEGEVVEKKDKIVDAA